MFNISNYSYENCGKKCKNLDHGDRINRVLVNNSVALDKLAAFIAKTCRNFAHVLDHQVGKSISITFTYAHFYLSINKCILMSGSNQCDFEIRFFLKGQSALHVATVARKFAIVEWLINNVSSKKK